MNLEVLWTISETYDIGWTVMYDRFKVPSELSLAIKVLKELSGPINLTCGVELYGPHFCFLPMSTVADLGDIPIKTTILNPLSYAS